MERWNGKIAVVTGASSGIGAAIVVDLVKSGMIVIGLARRQEKIDELQEKLTKFKGTLHSYKCDVSKEEDVKTAFAWICEKFGGIDVLINNAGIVRPTKLTAPNNSEQIQQVMDTNVMGVVWCTREAYQSMKKRSIAGHVIVINSICGHYVPYVASGGTSLNIYPSSKFAVTAMVEVLRQEFQADGTKTKITSISPGIVKSEIMTEKMINDYNLPALEAEDIAASVLYVLGTPPRVQVHELTIRPVGEKL